MLGYSKANEVLAFMRKSCGNGLYCAVFHAGPQLEIGYTRCACW